MEDTNIWRQEARFVPSEIYHYSPSNFGRSVAISLDGKVAVMGGEDIKGTHSYIYLWRNGRWSEHQRIDHTIMNYDGKLGGISADGTYILVGPKPDVYVRNGDYWQYQ